MIRQHIDVNGYWEVVVYYNVVGHYFFSNRTLRKALRQIASGRAKAATVSDLKHHKSTILLGNHKDSIDYINSIVHEAEHVKQAMLEAYHIEDSGEPPAYTIGFLVGEMWKVFNLLF